MYVNIQKYTHNDLSRHLNFQTFLLMFALGMALYAYIHIHIYTHRRIYLAFLFT
jgi:hypothetical protein